MDLHWQDLFKTEHCAHSTAAQGRHWWLMSYPPGMCTETKPSAAETEPSAIGTEKPFGGFLISLWFELRDLRSLDPQVDNISRQSRGTVQQWRGTCYACYWCPFTSLFMCQAMSLHPLMAITVLPYIFFETPTLHSLRASLSSRKLRYFWRPSPLGSDLSLNLSRVRRWPFTDLRR